MTHLLRCLALLTALCASPALAGYSDCTSNAFAVAIHDNGFICKEVREQKFALLGRQVSIRSLTDAEDPQGGPFELEAFNAIETSLAAFSKTDAGMPLKIADVTLVIIPNNVKSGLETKEISIAGVSSPFKDECVIRLYPEAYYGAQKDPIAYMQLVVAHELFHCVQHATFPKLLATYPKHAWWVEGTAELMSHLAFSNSNEAFTLNLEFSDKFRDTSLTSLSYENLVFFSWLWARDPKLLFKLGAMLVPDGTEASDQNVLANVVGAANLGQFVRDYLDAKITGPDGFTPLTMQTNIGAVTFSDTETRGLVSVPYAMFAIDATFQAGNYDISFENKGNLQWQHQDVSKPGTWGAGALKTEGTCSDDHTYRLAGMALDEASLEVKAEHADDKNCSVCGISSVRDQCLIGTWLIDNVQQGVTIADFIGGNANTWVNVQGGNGVHFKADGTSDWAYVNFDITVRNADPGVPKIGARINGTISQSWDGDKGKLNTCFVSAHAQFVIGTPYGMSDPINFYDVPDRKPDEHYAYQCMGDGSLLLEKTVGEDSFLMRLKRIN